MAIMRVGAEGAATGHEVPDAASAEAAAGTVAAAALQGARTPPRGIGSATAALAPAYAAMPTRVGYIPDPAAFAPAQRGYATQPTAVKTSAAKTSSATSKSTPAKSTAAKSTATSNASKATSTKSASTTTKSTSSKSSASAKGSTPWSATATELAFLDDPRLSIEDKLFRFMALMERKADAELIATMRDYEQKKKAAAATTKSESGASSSSGATEKKSSGGGGGGLFGMLGDALGGIAGAVVSGAESLAKDLGGPLLAAGVTAVGLPFLAPVALQVGGTLAKSAVGGLASAVGLDAASATARATAAAKPVAAATSKATASTSSSTSRAASSSSAAASGDGEFDEKLEMLNLQRLVEKQQTMFSALSNVLKAMHEGQMAVVNNIR